MNAATEVHLDHRDLFARLEKFVTANPSEPWERQLLADWRAAVRRGDAEGVLACVEEARESF
jgi:hypothetical protein